MQKHLIALFLALATQEVFAGLFGPDEETLQLRHALTEQQDTTFIWMIAAGILALLGVITFIVGTILGSSIRRKVNERKPD